MKILFPVWQLNWFQIKRRAGQTYTTTLCWQSHQ